VRSRVSLNTHAIGAKDVILIDLLTGDNPDTISRVVVGSKGTMPGDARMKPPKRTELSSPEIETDLSRIQSLSREHDGENWEFRSWLNRMLQMTLMALSRH